MQEAKQTPHQLPPNARADAKDSDEWRSIEENRTHLNFAAAQKARQAARLETISSQRDGVQQFGNKPEEESAALFQERFAIETQGIRVALDQLVEECKDKRMTGGHVSGSGAVGTAGEAAHGKEPIRARLDTLVDRVKGLRKLAAEATLFLPFYEQRRALEDVGRLLASVESTRAELAPRKKFAFRSRTGDGARSATRHGSRECSTVDVEAVDVRGVKDRRREVGADVQGLQGQEVQVEAKEINHDKDFTLADLNGCTIKIFHELGALRIRRLISCLVVCGPVRGPIYVEGCKDCVVVAAGRQLRIHETYGVDFYVTVASGPIIEDCSRLRFAPSEVCYPLHDQHLTAAGFADVKNLWDDVKDFKWHRAHKSPNWDIIPEEERRMPPSFPRSSAEKLLKTPSHNESTKA